MDSAQESRRRTPAIAVSAILSAGLLLSLYIGSSAPAFGLVFTGDMRRDRFDAIYAPLQSLADRSPPIKRGLHAYWEWWLQSFGYYPAAQAASGDARPTFDSLPPH
jgi:hypothetical protein